MTDLLSAALIYAEKAGWYIFPCGVDKKPLVKNGLKQATTDLKQIKLWWTKWPDASIGCACGPESKIWVLDIDLPDGPESLKKLERQYGPLPITRCSQTGSGGFQYFWSWNGHEIRNTASRIAHKIDSRGLGGYIILPPSNHPSGNQYEWINRPKTIPYAPDWLTNLLIKKDPSFKPSTQNGSNSKYGEKALADEIIKLSHVGQGQRNDVLNTAAFSLGQLIAGGELEQGHVFNSLLGIALSIGLPENEATATINSGLKSGYGSPRKAPEKEPDIEYSYDDEVTCSHLKSDEVNEVALKSPCSHSEVTLKSLEVTPSDQKSKKVVYSLANEIEEYVKNSEGSFTVDQIDKEFGLTTRQAKKNRSVILLRMARNKIIIKDNIFNGKFHIVNSTVEWVDLFSKDEESFDIELPFNLNNHVLIPPHSIIIVAGSGDAGKTTFILNTLKLNREKKYKKLYLMSEMGVGEYKRKIRQFGEPFENWKCIQAAQRSHDFNGVITHHNTDGLTCIDYLEEVEGRYYEMASHIRHIYDSLLNGVAVIALQKKSTSEYGKGGESTMEKSRLYVSIDYICTVARGIVCAIKIMKAKHFLGDNYKNYELHFKIHGQNEMEIIMPWTRSSNVDRARCKIDYERAEAELSTNARHGDDGYVFKFKTKTGKTVGLTLEHFQKWQTQFQNIDVSAELEQYSRQSFSGQTWIGDNWFFQVSGVLAKQNDRAKKYKNFQDKE